MFDYAWALADGDLADGSLENVATTPLLGDVEALAQETIYLVLPAASLTPGAWYQFSLTTTYSDAATLSQESGYSLVMVQVNAPPSSGVLTLEPHEGIVLETRFRFSCSGWVDDAADLPLRYTFAYAISGTIPVIEYQASALNSVPSYDDMLLPQGGGNASEVIGIVYVIDQVGRIECSRVVE